MKHHDPFRYAPLGISKWWIPQCTLSQQLFFTTSVSCRVSYLDTPTWCTAYLAFKFPLITFQYVLLNSTERLPLDKSCNFAFVRAHACLSTVFRSRGLVRMPTCCSYVSTYMMRVFTYSILSRMICFLWRFRRLACLLWWLLPYFLDLAILSNVSLVEHLGAEDEPIIQQNHLLENAVPDHATRFYLLSPPLAIPRRRFLGSGVMSPAVGSGISSMGCMAIGPPSSYANKSCSSSSSATSSIVGRKLYNAAKVLPV